MYLQHMNSLCLNMNFVILYVELNLNVLGISMHLGLAHNNPMQSNITALVAISISFANHNDNFVLRWRCSFNSQVIVEATVCGIFVLACIIL